MSDQSKVKVVLRDEFIYWPDKPQQYPPRDIKTKIRTRLHEQLPHYTQKEINYLDEMFDRRMEDPRA